MTDAEKLADYDRIVALLKDRIELEKHCREENLGFDAVQKVRVEAYEAIVNLIFGPTAMSWRGLNLDEQSLSVI